MVVEKLLFDDLNLTDGATFLTDLTHCAKTRANKIIKFPCGTKRHIWKIAINNGWNTHNVQILHEIRDVNFFQCKFSHYTNIPY